MAPLSPRPAPRHASVTLLTSLTCKHGIEPHGAPPRATLQTGPGPVLPSPLDQNAGLFYLCANNTASARIAAWSPIAGVYPSEVNGNNTTKGTLETRSLPWWAFVANGTAFDLAAVKSVTIKVGGGDGSSTGRIAIDDLEVTPWP